MAKFISVNKYMTEVKEELDPFAYLNVYFYHFEKSTFDKVWNIEPVKFAIVTKNGAKFEDLDIDGMLTVKENFDRKFSKLEEGKAYKLVIPYEPKKADDYEYYESKIVEVQGKLGKKILESKPVFAPKEEENIDIDPEMF
ncbi:hypothetical protein TVAG_070400 [Trichomonas vaginalis G3]|uniref:Uncharacterized protein n=2 Tax=Trichomonas vaginalis (strain ATCC PRA-98 / G3) TaxID=412133 RepID=A2D7U4_TRIV3|nr:hypothetical protein TVAGG3_1044880 [Trichomonas vaginalis G3]XP_051081462.1 protein of unknown function, DUF4108 family [Trichomonas vaginalis G3]XP_051081551.1 protein of unknown function, DUF4108 family [Trichomonas vaginalis G3]XP_051086140.1 protein of unknown function, DUF4108 family [Trichomonas vaginalis G3]XP_051102490.1 protein of unknown function, DUF4108 family [Trichomonas vaginalis G3]XP_051113099.1 protein of unknown function, DUF4108 family [Trichomonas vaginalis G3]EAX6525|eukprot:XP_001278181.1 hypothetical protein [Trichomonas vaginalis G3]